MRRKIPDFLTPARPEWALSILIIVAAGLRFWQLDVLPPGLFFDEAYNGLDATRVLTGADRPIFFVGNNGREPLFIYLQALSVGFLGATPLALRITSAVIGIVTVPIIFFSARVILPVRASSSTRPLIDARLVPWLALIAAAGVAVSYWHVSLSRVGFRAILLVPVSALAIAFFWRAWTRMRWRDYIWSGIWFGVAFYTYTASRALPFVVLFFVLTELALDLVSRRFSDGQKRALWKQRLKRLLLMGAVAGLIVSPLLWVIIQDTELFTARATEVSILSVSQQEMPGSALERLLNNVIAVARNFYDKGDQNQRHNLPGRPVNDPWLAILFTLGWVSAVWRIRLARNRFLLMWLMVMLMPTVLSTEAPHSLRSTGALPAVAMFYAVGGEAIYLGWMHLKDRRSSRSLPANTEPDDSPWGVPRTWKALVLFVLLLVLVVSGGKTFDDYFHRWATAPALGYSFETDLQLAARETANVLADGQDDHAVLLSGSLFSQPQLRFALGRPISMDSSADTLLPSSEPETQTRFIFDDNFDPRRPLALLWRDGDQVKAAWTAPLVVPAHEAIRQEEDNYLFPRSIVWPNHQPGWPIVFTGLLPDDMQFCPQIAPQPLPVDFANGMRLVGYDIDLASSPVGGMVDLVYLTLYWQQQLVTDDRYGLPEEQATLHDFSVSVHLMQNENILQIQDGPILTEFIRDRSYVGGRVVKDVRTFISPALEPAGDKYFQIGLFELDAGQPLATSRIIPVIDEGTRSAANPEAAIEDPVDTSMPQTGQAGADGETVRSVPLTEAGYVIIPWSERYQTQSPDNQGCHELANQWLFLSQAWTGDTTLLAHLWAYPLSDQQYDRYGSALPGVRYPAVVRFANGLRLIAYGLQPDSVDSDNNDRKVRLSLFWQGDAPNPAASTGYQDVTWWNASEFDVFAHLTDGNAVWQTANRRFTGKQILDRGGIVESVHEFVIPQDMAIGKAYFEAGLYYYAGPDSSATGSKRIPIVDQKGQAAGNLVTLGGVMIGEQPPLGGELSLPIQATFQDYIELSALRVEKNAAGNQVKIVLDWQALDRPAKDYTAFVHLIDREQAIVAQHDQPPGGVENPTHLWAPDEMVRASFPLQLPPDVELDELTLRMGLYNPVTGDRLPILSLENDQFSAPDGTYLLVPLTAAP